MALLTYRSVQLKIAAFCLTGLLVTNHASSESLSAQIDDVFASIDPGAPGCNVGVLRNSEWVHKAGYGLANMELDVPLDGSQVHRMASVSKQFTAMAVLLLADEGKIDLASSVHQYLPDLPDYGAVVSVNAMLGHFSGMGDYDLIAGSYEGPIAEQSVGLRSAAGGPFRLGNEDYLTIKEFYDVVKQVPLALPPEQEFSYSNLAYFLLSMLVETVSGESLRDYAQRRIFGPLGMNETFFSDDPVEIVPNRASGYKERDAGGYVTDMTNLFWVGDGGLHTNLEDMRKWDQHFYAPTLGADPATLLALMNTPNSDHEARGARYANGQFLRTINNERAFAHSGGWLGTSTFYVRFPDRRTSLIAMCNDASLEVEPFFDRVIDIILSE
ncbi:MAG: serine hydrolase domain-containing protein [Pseudomonadota bacterium]